MRALLAVLLLLAPPAAAQTVLRVGYQRIGALVLLRQQHRLEQALAPIAVQWVEFASGPPLLEALNAGAIDIGYGGDMPPIFAAAAGVDFVFVAAQPLNGDNEGLLLPPGSDIASVEALRGRAVAVTKGSSAHNFLVRVLEAHAMSPADLRLRYLQPAECAAAFARGSVDAWAVWDPYYAIAQQRPGVRLLTDGRDVAPSNNFFLAGRAYATANPAILRRVIDEVNEVAAWAQAHPHDLATSMAEATSIDPAAEAVASARGSYRAVPMTDDIVAQEQAIADRFARLHIIPSAVDIAAHVTRPPGL